MQGCINDVDHSWVNQLFHLLSIRTFWLIQNINRAKYNQFCCNSNSFVTYLPTDGLFNAKQFRQTSVTFCHSYRLKHVSVKRLCKIQSSINHYVFKRKNIALFQLLISCIIIVEITRHLWVACREIFAMQELWYNRTEQELMKHSAIYNAVHEHIYKNS